MLIHRVGLEIAHAGEKEDPKGNLRLQTVCIDDQGRIAACDGHMWLRMSALVNEPDLFTTDALADLHPMRAESATLPIGVVRDFNAACKRGKSVDQVVVSSGEDGQTTLATVDGKTTRTFLVKSDDIVFPEVDKTLPVKPAIANIIFSVDLLRKLVRTLKACDAKSVALTIYGDIDPVRIDARCIVGEGESLKSIEGAIMPMYPDKQSEVDRHEASDDESPDDTNVKLTDETGAVLFEGTGAELSRAADALGEFQQQ